MVFFYIPSLNLALEVDGLYWHRDAEKDLRKRAFLESMGYSVLNIVCKNEHTLQQEFLMEFCAFLLRHPLKK